MGGESHDERRGKGPPKYRRHARIEGSVVLLRPNGGSTPDSASARLPKHEPPDDPPDPVVHSSRLRKLRSRSTEPANLSPPVALGVVECAVCPLNECLNAPVGRFRNCDTDTARQRYRTLGRPDFRLRNMGRDSPRELLWNLGLGISDPTHHELVSAESGNDIGGSGGDLEGLG